MKIINKYFYTIDDSNIISYKEFYDDIMNKNILCLFNKKYTDKWKARSEWISEGRINLDFLVDKYGNFECPVYNCNESYFNSNPCESMKFSSYINYWKKFSNNEVKEILYLKDWVCFKHNLIFNIYLAIKAFLSRYRR